MINGFNQWRIQYLIVRCNRLAVYSVLWKVFSTMTTSLVGVQHSWSKIIFRWKKSSAFRAYVVPSACIVNFFLHILYKQTHQQKFVTSESKVPDPLQRICTVSQASFCCFPLFDYPIILFMSIWQDFCYFPWPAHSSSISTRMSEFLWLVHKDHIF